MTFNASSTTLPSSAARRTRAHQEPSSSVPNDTPRSRATRVLGVSVSKSYSRVAAVIWFTVAFTAISHTAASNSPGVYRATVVA